MSHMQWVLILFFSFFFIIFYFLAYEEFAENALLEAEICLQLVLWVLP